MFIIKIIHKQVYIYFQRDINEYIFKLYSKQTYYIWW